MLGWKQRKKREKWFKKRDRERRKRKIKRETHKVTGREAEAEWSDSVLQPGLNTNSFICWHPLPPDTAVNCTYYHILCRHTSLSPEHTHKSKDSLFADPRTHWILRDRKRLVRYTLGQHIVHKALVQFTHVDLHLVVISSSRQVGAMDWTQGHLHSEPVWLVFSLAMG